MPESQCCGRYLAGERAPTAEALMRSRYTAYATGDTGHLIRTTHPDSPHREADVRAWAEELRRYCAAVRFLGLTVDTSGEGGDTGRVRFYARMALDGRDVSFGEDSRFLRVDGRWLYVDGARWTPDGPRSA